MKRTRAKSDLHERRVFFFACKICGKTKRQSFRRRRARDKVCWKCRRGAVHENQLTLLPLPAEKESSTLVQ